VRLVGYLKETAVRCSYTQNLAAVRMYAIAVFFKKCRCPNT